MINLPESGNTPPNLHDLLLKDDYQSVTLGVYWPDDWKYITLSRAQVLAIISGERLEILGDGYSYDGHSFQDKWVFSGIELEVDYSEMNEDIEFADEGCGWVGTLFRVDNIEFVKSN